MSEFKCRPGDINRPFNEMCFQGVSVTVLISRSTVFIFYNKLSKCVRAREDDLTQLSQGRVSSDV